MLSEEFIDQLDQVGMSAGSREQMSFFSSEVVLDLLFEMLLDFRLPGCTFGRGRQGSTVDAYAEGESVLVLARERDEVLVAKHQLDYPTFGHFEPMASSKAVGSPAEAGPERGSGKGQQASATSAFGSALLISFDD